MSPSRPPVSIVHRAAGGFTLVELLVALLIMALLAALGWQGVAGMVRARDGSRAALDRSVRLNTVLTQWQQDLQAIFQTDQVPALAFDGQTLRLTRRVDNGVAVVAWSVRDGVWRRWSSAGVTRADDLQQNWLRSQQLQGNEPGQITLTSGAMTLDASDCQIYFNRGGLWSNAQSTGDLAQVAVVPAAEDATAVASAASAASGSAGAAAPAAPAAAAAPVAVRELLPDGVRLVITLDGQTLTRDIALGPTGS